MKHALKSRTTGLATVLAATAVLAGCSKEKGENVPPEETLTNPTEVTIYTNDANKALNVASCLSYVFAYEDGSSVPTGQTLICDVDVSLESMETVSHLINFTYGDVKIVLEPLTAMRITGIDLITNADYDDAHPKGSLLNDIMELHYIGPDGRYYSIIDLTEYFKTYSGLDIKDGFVFRLAAKTLPPKKNHIMLTGLAGFKEGESLLAVDVTLKITLEDGTTLSIAPVPGMKI